MTTEKQTAANRANALKSTGPRTDEGKTVSAQNARTHGLLAKNFVAANEDQARFEALLVELEKEFAPQTATEHELVAKLAANFWRDWRLAQFERRAIETEHAKAETDRASGAYVSTADEPETWLLRATILARYQAMISNETRRTLSMLQEQIERRTRSIGGAGVVRAADPFRLTAARHPDRMPIDDQ